MKQQNYQHYHQIFDKYEYLTGEEILPSDQSITIEQAKSMYSPLGKNFRETNANDGKTRRKTNKSNLKLSRKDNF